MARTPDALIKPELLVWARQSAGFSVDAAAAKLRVSEDRLRAAIAGAESTGAQLKDGIAYLLGTAWDAELEPYRASGEDTPVRVLHHVV